MYQLALALRTFASLCVCDCCKPFKWQLQIALNLRSPISRAEAAMQSSHRIPRPNTPRRLGEADVPSRGAGIQCSCPNRPRWVSSRDVLPSCSQIKVFRGQCLGGLQKIGRYAGNILIQLYGQSWCSSSPAARGRSSLCLSIRSRTAAVVSNQSRNAMLPYLVPLVLLVHPNIDGGPSDHLLGSA